jgi:hypothetical protein
MRYGDESILAADALKANFGTPERFTGARKGSRPACIQVEEQDNAGTLLLPPKKDTSFDAFPDPPAMQPSFLHLSNLGKEAD